CDQLFIRRKGDSANCPQRREAELFGTASNVNEQAAVMQALVRVRQAKSDVHAAQDSGVRSCRPTGDGAAASNASTCSICVLGGTPVRPDTQHTVTPTVLADVRLARRPNARFRLTRLAIYWSRRR